MRVIVINKLEKLYNFFKVDTDELAQLAMKSDEELLELLIRFSQVYSANKNIIRQILLEKYNIKYDVHVYEKLKTDLNKPERTRMSVDPEKLNAFYNEIKQKMSLEDYNLYIEEI